MLYKMLISLCNVRYVMLDLQNEVTRGGKSLENRSDETMKKVLKNKHTFNLTKARKYSETSELVKEEGLGN